MKVKHYKSMLSAFVNHELGGAEQEEIGRHLMQCGDCRGEHDRVKLGSALAATMTGHDAPQRVWNSIETELEERSGPGLTLIADASYFGPRNVASYAVGLIVLVALASVAYLTFVRPETDQAQREAPLQ